jgi:hypothetical protein
MATQKEMFLVTVGYEALAVGTIDQATRLVNQLNKMMVVERDYEDKDDKPTLKRRKHMECSIERGYRFFTPARSVRPSSVPRPALTVDVHRLPDRTEPLLPLSIRRLLP